MKKLVIGAGLFLVLATGYYLLLPSLFKDPCGADQLKLASTSIEMKDRDHLKISMGFSYGSKLNRYLPRLKSAKSYTYYKKKKSKPWLTYFSSGFKTRRSAKSAYNYLKRKWRGNKKNQYDVMLNGKTVTWFGNNRFTPQCFSKIVALEKERLKKESPAVAPAKKVRVKRLARKSKRKRRSKAKTKKRRSKKRRVVAKKSRRRRK